MVNINYMHIVARTTDIAKVSRQQVLKQIHLKLN